MIDTRQSVERFHLAKGKIILEERRRGFGVNTTKRYTNLVDRFIRELMDSAGPGRGDRKTRFSVVGTGSYGRRELCFGSDVDLMIIHRGGLSGAEEKRIARALYPLWDARLELGYTFLTPKECLELVRKKFSVLTALMDARLIYGSRALFKDFERYVWSELALERKEHLDRFLAYQDMRDKKYGRANFFLEPDIKEGLGGIRDLHFMAWIARLYFGVRPLGRMKAIPDFSHFGLSQLIYSKRFLLKIRNHLHLASGRRDDRLLIAQQQQLSKTLGYHDRPYSTGPERFMRNLYLHLNRVRYGREQFQTKALDMIIPLPPDPQPERLSSEFKVIKGNIVLGEESPEPKDPMVVLRAFDQANRNRLFLGSGFIWEARKTIIYKGRELLRTPGAKELFLCLILEPRNPRIIRLALEIGLIDLFIPEFTRIRNLAQFGYYHVDTVDIHSLRTLEIIYQISKGGFDERWPSFRKVFKALKHPKWLYLAALIHDIGKGYRGDHSVKGAAVVPRVLQRLGLSGEAVKVVSFLVERHLFLVNISQKRDLNDEKTAVQAAQVIQRPELLNLLFLLTVADCFATGPNASGEWKMTLLTELFSKVRRILERGSLATPDATNRVRDKKERLYKKLVKDFPKPAVVKLADQASTRYFLNTPQEDIEKHFRLALRLGDKRLAWRRVKMDSAPVTKLILCTYDRPGLFSQMVGL
ncbi:MAG: HD domain-containing protein, partial [Desulfobacteraceae bacterium]